MELVEEQIEEEAEGYPEELHGVFETLADIYGGVQVATENDCRGRSRKLVRQYVEREDLSSVEMGAHSPHFRGTWPRGSRAQSLANPESE